MNDYIPHLRVRTEYSFGEVYGPVDEVAQSIEAPFAAICDTTTFGHVAWNNAADGFKPGFGKEIQLKQEDGKKPSALILATDTKQFYDTISAGIESEQDLVGVSGCLRLGGAFATNADAWDYLYISPSSVTAARATIEKAKELNLSVLLVGENYYPEPEDRNKFLAFGRNEQMTPQHLLTSIDDWRHAFWFLDDEEFRVFSGNTCRAASKCSSVGLPQAPILKVEGDLRQACLEGKKRRLELGHITEWTDEYEDRLETELEIIQEKDFDSYFLVVADLIGYAKQHMLVGPARGSSGGSLVCYLMNITEIDPMPHGLLFSRFVDPNRMDYPDIDTDFEDRKRDMLVPYLEEKYGKTHVAKIGSVNRLKPRSALKHAGKKLAIPLGETFNVTNVLVEYSSGDSRYGKALADTLENTKPGQSFKARFPESHLVEEIENHASHSGVHAAGILVSNEPVTHYCEVKDHVAQLDKKDTEALDLLKIDALGLRTLGIIADAGVVDADALYGLKLDDPKVFDVFNSGKLAGVFQFEGATMRAVAKEVPVTSFRQIDNITALARPGPLGSGASQKYIDRINGRKPIEFDHPTLEPILKDTFGVMLYQEQIMRVVREVGNFSWEETSFIRKAISGRKGKEWFDQKGEQFVQGAAQNDVPREVAEEIWSQMVTFGAWGMNASHTVAYSVISYWCAWLKAYHPMEYAAACLRSAKDDESAMEMLRELRDEGISVVPFDIEQSDASWSAKGGSVYGGFDNLIGIGPVKAAKLLEKRKAGELTEKDIEKHAVKFADLSPLHTKYGDMYDNPENYNINGRLRNFNECEDRRSCVVIGQVTKATRRDKNEALLVQKRSGEIYPGQSQFLDLYVVDDSTSNPMIARINPDLWESVGEDLADTVQKDDCFLIRGRWLDQFNMMIVQRIKKL